MLYSSRLSGMFFLVLMLRALVICQEIDKGRAMPILVTGGAGYVGSVIVEDLLNQGRQVVVLDNLQQGHRPAVLPEAAFVQADCGDSQALDSVFNRFKIDAVMHLAGDSIVSLSVTDPQRFFQNNIAGGISLLNTMLKHNVNKIIFSSSAATYGEPQKIPIEEDHPQVPVNPYGETKLMFETILKWYGKAYGLKSLSLRYFNAAGASDRLGEDHHPETHLIPIVLKAALNGQNPVSIFGRDYPTRDGTCIRDYVHVSDIAQAHILGLERIDELSGRAYNLGNGAGFSVLEVVQAAQKICGVSIPTLFSPRRGGDPSVLLASSARAKKELGWQPKYSDIDQIVETAWNWLKKHPDGYTD
jgi:UDP-glucose 4-epimerase